MVWHPQMSSRIFHYSFFIILGAFFLSPSLVHARTMDDHAIVKLRSLDKVTARTETFEARVGSTIQFGELYIKVQACRKAPPIEQPESAAFLQMWELDLEDNPQWVFSGWMFASSPALSSMDHAIYDVWVLDCLDRVETVEPLESIDGDLDSSEQDSSQENGASIDVETIEAN